MSLLSFSTSERNEAETSVASETSASESRRARRTALRREPRLGSAVVSEDIFVSVWVKAARPAPLLTRPAR